MPQGAVANLTQCGLAVDATAASALTLSGGAVVNATSVSVSGTASVTGGASVSPSSALKTSQANIPDPYAAVVMPTFSGCAGGNNASYGGGTWTLQPGVYRNGISFDNAAKATMSAAVYFVARGYFSLSGGATVTGSNVTIILTSSTGSGYATASISNGTTLTLRAPTTGNTRERITWAS
jgi:hypothetical protein